MKDFPEIPQPIIPDICASRDHYFNMIVDGKCFSCVAVWGLAPHHEYGKPIEDVMEVLDDEQMKHREFPSDAEIDEMYALAGSDSNEYRTAH